MSYRTVEVKSIDEEYKCSKGHSAIFMPGYIPGTNSWEKTGKLHCCDCRADENVKIIFKPGDDVEEEVDLEELDGESEYTDGPAWPLRR